MEVDERPGLAGSAYAAADAIIEAAEEAAAEFVAQEAAHKAAQASEREAELLQRLAAQQVEYTEQVQALTRLIARQTELTGARLPRSTAFAGSLLASASVQPLTLPLQAPTR